MCGSREESARGRRGGGGRLSSGGGVGDIVCGWIVSVWFGAVEGVGGIERVVGIIVCVCLGVVVVWRQEQILNGDEGVPAPQTTGRVASPGIW